MTDTITKEAILVALSKVQEPELNNDLVTLNMIRELEINDNVVSFTIMLTTPACPLRGQIEKEARQAVMSVEGVKTVSIKWDSDVPNDGRMRGLLNMPIRNAIAVGSGKGGVGKSTVAVNIAVALAQAGASVGLLDADVYGPSIPLMMGTRDRPLMKDQRIVPIEAHGVRLMSIGFILDPEKALIWRGPLVAQLITQFLNDVDWGDLDYLIIDLPPGTGDAQLTLVQRIPISGAVIVTTTQEVALADAVKGLKMFQEVKTPILGIVENMSGFVCPSCNEVSEIFSSGGGKRTAEQYNVELLGQTPLEPSVREGGDTGQPLVEAAPDSATGVAFRALADRVADSL